MLGVSPAITAGAVISGAYLGDKTSPLSETTILTAQMVKVDVYQHIRRQVWTSVPAFAIALAAFFVIGFLRGPDVHAPLSEQVELASLDQVYDITASGTSCRSSCSRCCRSARCRRRWRW